MLFSESSVLSAYNFLEGDVFTFDLGDFVKIKILDIYIEKYFHDDLEQDEYSIDKNGYIEGEITDFSADGDYYSIDIENNKGQFARFHLKHVANIEMTSQNDLKIGCSFCNPDHDDYLYAECLCDDGDGGYDIIIETSQWDDYYDQYVVEVLSDVSFCPYCGRKMTIK